MSGPSGGAGLFLSSISLACGTCHSPPVSNLPIWRDEPSNPTAPTLTASCPREAVHVTLHMSVEGKKARVKPLRLFRPGEGRSEDVRSRRCAARQEACVGRRAPTRRPSHFCTLHSCPMIHCVDRCRNAQACRCIARSVGSVHAAGRPATSWDMSSTW